MDEAKQDIMDRWSEGYISDGEAIMWLTDQDLPIGCIQRIAREMMRREKELADVIHQSLSKSRQ
jgi:hypothetical protein